MISDQQTKRIEKLKTDEFYLIGFEKKDENVYDILMTGSKKDVYKVVLTIDGHMKCNCPDSESHAKKYGVLCKHICFIYLKICKGTDLNFFTTKKLKNDDIGILKARTELLTSVDIAKKYYEKYLNQTSNTSEKKTNLSFDEAKREIDMSELECPICFEELKSSIKYCPDCSNPVHEKCVLKWLESHDSCIYCRSEIWSKYNNEKKAEKKENNDKYKYINVSAS